MRIVLDNIIFSLQKAGGISGAWAILVRELLKRPGLDIRFLEREDARGNIFRSGLHIPSSRIITAKRLPLALDRYMPVRLRGDAPFVFHSSYYRTCTSSLARNVVTLHDFIYEEAGVHPPLAKSVHSWQKSRALRHASAIAAVSHTTRSKLQDRFPGMHATVIPNPAVCAPCTFTRDTSPREDGYVLFVGGRDSYKNFPAALRVTVSSGLAMRIAGAPLTDSEKRLIGTLPGTADIKAIPFPDRKSLSALYAGALCLLYPSAHEGFGIPVVEAQSHGCPVLIGPCAACMETAGEGAVVADNFTEEAFASALARLASDQSLRRDLAARGYENILRFDPSALATAYLDLYKDLLDH